jgi:hypothetical protein
MSKRVLIISVIPAELSNLLEEIEVEVSKKRPLKNMYYYWEKELVLESTGV